MVALCYFINNKTRKARIWHNIEWRCQCWCKWIWILLSKMETNRKKWINAQWSCKWANTIDSVFSINHTRYYPKSAYFQHQFKFVHQLFPDSANALFNIRLENISISICLFIHSRRPPLLFHFQLVYSITLIIIHIIL